MQRNYNFIATPPGATIKEQLEDKGINQSEFATKMEMSEESLNRLLDGRARLTSEIATKLENILGVPAKFWINLEAVYRKKQEHNSLKDYER